MLRGVSNVYPHWYNSVGQNIRNTSHSCSLSETVFKKTNPCHKGRIYCRTLVLCCIGFSQVSLINWQLSVNVNRVSSKLRKLYKTLRMQVIVDGLTFTRKWWLYLVRPAEAKQKPHSAADETVYEFMYIKSFYFLFSRLPSFSMT